MDPMTMTAMGGMGGMGDMGGVGDVASSSSADSGGSGDQSMGAKSFTYGAKTGIDSKWLIGGAVLVLLAYIIKGKK